MRVSIITAALLLIGSAVPAAEIEYLPLHALGMSEDGSTVVGRSGPWWAPPEAAHWTRATGVTRLGPGTAHEASFDGSVVVGTSGGIDPQAFRWTEEAGMVLLGTLPGFDRSYTNAVSADGSVVVGDSWAMGESLAFRWTEESGMQPLGTVRGNGNGTRAYDVSADGSVTAGVAYSNSEPWLDTVAVRWTEDSGLVQLGFLPGKTSSRVGYGPVMSADGSIIAGVSERPGSKDFFLWTEDAGMTALPTTGTGDYPIISPDGEIVLTGIPIWARGRWRRPTSGTR